MDGMEQEQHFLEAQGNAKRFTINGENLTLYSAEDQVILRFKAVYLK